MKEYCQTVSALDGSRGTALEMVILRRLVYLGMNHGRRAIHPFVHETPRMLV